MWRMISVLISMHDHWTNHSFDNRDLVGKMMSLLFNMLSRFVIAFLPRSKHLLVTWLQSPSAVILEPKKIKYATAYTFPPSICHEEMGPDAMILVFWKLSFRQLFHAPLSLSSRGSLIPLHFLPSEWYHKLWGQTNLGSNPDSAIYWITIISNLTSMTWSVKWALHRSHRVVAVIIREDMCVWYSVGAQYLAVSVSVLSLLTWLSLGNSVQTIHAQCRVWSWSLAKQRELDKFIRSAFYSSSWDFLSITWCITVS